MLMLHFYFDFCFFAFSRLRVFAFPIFAASSVKMNRTLMIEDYGNGPSTGFDQTVSGKTFLDFTHKDLFFSLEDKNILKKLAEQVAGIAHSRQMLEKCKLWQELNNLKKTRPLIFCDPENGWNEIITETQMECKGKIARHWEMALRKEIFWGKEMGDDKPVEPVFDIAHLIKPDNWGVEIIYHQTENLGSYVWDNPIMDYEQDLKKIHSPRVVIDWETTNGCFDLASDIFKGILNVRLKGIWWWSLGITNPAASLRGLNNLYLDFIDRPDELKELFSIISTGFLEKLKFLENNNLLSLNNDSTYVGSGGFGFTEKLPRPDYLDQVRCKDMWGFAESQETVNVSPEMYEQFIFPYEKIILDKFGLTCYGCCEPLDSRWHIVKNHHNLRRVSCSAWIDMEKMARYLGDSYIFSLKPNPAPLSGPGINEQAIRKELRSTFEITKDCNIEVIMKDNHTIGHRPENVVEWCRIAKEEAYRVSNA